MRVCQFRHFGTGVNSEKLTVQEADLLYRREAGIRNWLSALSSQPSAVSKDKPQIPSAAAARRTPPALGMTKSWRSRDVETDS